MSDPHSKAEEFVSLLASHERVLGAYVMTMVPNASDADDILQDAKVIMWRAFAQFQTGTNFGAWARKICFHQVLSFRKRRHRDKLSFSDEFLTAIAGEMEDTTDHLEQRERALHHCLLKLGKEHREVLDLRYGKNLELEEMSKLLDRTTTALYRLLSRIRHALHGCITQTLAETAHDL